MKKISSKFHRNILISTGFIFLIAIGMHISNMDFFKGIFFASLFLLITLALHTILHELGHLIFGLVSGYKFVSFRVGSLTLIKENDKFSFKKLSIPGTIGQALMAPTEGTKTDYPYKLYNWGGIIINIIITIISMALYLSSESEMVKLLALTSVVMGAYLIIMNAIPVEGANTDGTNLVDLNASEDARIALYNMLETNRLFQEGYRPREIPKELLDGEQYKDKNNPLVASMIGNSYSSLLDEGEYVKAFKLLKDTIHSSSVSDLMKLILMFEYSTVAMLLGNYEIANNNLKDKQSLKLSKFNKLKEIVRFNYIYNLLVLKDDETANEYLGKFERLIVHDPFSGDVEFNRDLIRKAREIRKFEDKIIRLDTVDSTNSYAKELAKKNEDINAVISKVQSSGRGQRENTFFSPRGGLYVSIILKPSISIEESKYLSAFAAVLVAESISEIFGKETEIKWVNDLFYNDKKVGGILTETVLSDENSLDYAIIGIGLNLYKSEIVPEEIGKIFGTLEISNYELYMRQLEYDLIEAINTLSVSQNINEMINKYNERLYNKGEYVRFKREDLIIKGKLIGVTEDLKIKIDLEGQIKDFAYGEVKLIFDDN